MGTVMLGIQMESNKKITCNIPCSLILKILEVLITLHTSV